MMRYAGKIESNIIPINIGRNNQVAQIILRIGPSAIPQNIYVCGIESIDFVCSNTFLLFRNPIFSASYTLFEWKRKSENQNISRCLVRIVSSISVSAQKSSRNSWI